VVLLISIPPIVIGSIGFAKNKTWILLITTWLIIAGCTGLVEAGLLFTFVNKFFCIWISHESYELSNNLNDFSIIFISRCCNILCFSGIIKSNIFLQRITIHAYLSNRDCSVIIDLAPFLLGGYGIPAIFQSETINDKCYDDFFYYAVVLFSILCFSTFFFGCYCVFLFWNVRCKR
jgi:hypothetical protein